MPDPFDALRAPSGPVAPRPAFAEALRHRLEGALHDLLPTDAATAAGIDPTRSTVDLGERKDTAMSTIPTATPTTTPAGTGAPLTGATRMRPYLVAAGAAEAIEFYQRAFGAIVDLRLDQRDGRVGHAELHIGDGAAFAIADEFPEYGFVGPTTRGGTTVSLTLDVPDVDALFARAVAAGATAERDPMDEFYGARAATVRDPWGHRWHLHAQLEELTQEEMQRRLDALDEG